MPQLSASTVAIDPPNERNLALGYLRGFVTLLVVLHHTLLAYVRFAPPGQPPMDASLFWTAFPIVDSQRWVGADLIVGFNDTFFMALMFLLSGVFVWPSLQRKGAAPFVRDRFRRLALPFVVAAGLLATLAYYPTWLASPAHAGSFWEQWLALGVWPAGPAWFLWVLLLFGVVAALLSVVASGWVTSLGRMADRLGQRPLAFFGGLLLVSSLVYLPMTAWFDPARWLKAGPFFVQISRLPLYFIYFMVGVGVGAHGTASGLLASDGRLARRWLLWALLSLLAFALSTITMVMIAGALSHGGASQGFATFGNFAYVLSCASASFALLSLFTHFVRHRHGAIDSLDTHAYGIYLLHYVGVTWMQYALLAVHLPAIAKIALVFLGATAFAWTLAAWLRRLPWMARIL